MERRIPACFTKRVYSLLTPYVQIAGWLAVAIPATISAAQLIGDARAFEQRLNTVEQAQASNTVKIDRISDKLDLVIHFVRPQK